MMKNLWSRHAKLSGKHKEIAALICHKEGKLPYVAILGTGTVHRDNDKCFHEDTQGHECNHLTCDGHAESIVYEGAPKYFMDQMQHLLNDKEMSRSIFEKSSADGEPLKFKLKSKYKFYLMVTDPPCGFIQDQKEPCMEWKNPFVGYPHVPKCSSRILIGATMGIQGCVSHLLEEPILIESVVILCTEGKENQEINFGRSFRLPRIKTLKYNPGDFSRCIPQNLMKREGEKHKKIDGTKLCSLTIGSPYREGKCSTCLGIDPRTGELIPDPRTEEVIPDTEHFRIIKNTLRKVQKKEEMQLREKYTKLHTDLALNVSLKKLQESLESKLEETAIDLKLWGGDVSDALEETTDTRYSYLQSTKEFDKTSYEKEWDKMYKQFVENPISNIKKEMKNAFENKEMICNIQDILKNNKEIIMDCTWHCYFKSMQDS